MRILYLDIARIAEKVSNGRKPFSLAVSRPERHGFTVIAGKNARHYTTKLAVSTQLSNTTPPRAA